MKLRNKNTYRIIGVLTPTFLILDFLHLLPFNLVIRTVGYVAAPIITTILFFILETRDKRDRAILAVNVVFLLLQVGLISSYMVAMRGFN